MAPDRCLALARPALVRLAPLSLLAALALGCGGDGSGAGNDAGPGGGPDAEAVGPDAGGEPTCVFEPTGEFNPAVECSWASPAEGSAYPSHDDVVATPVVVNMTDDNGDNAVDTDDVPDIAFIAYPLQEGTACPGGATCGCCNSSGVLRVVSGGCQDGTLPEHFTVGPAEIEADIGVSGVWLDNSGGLAAGDIDADGSVDLVATVMGGGTIAFERDGTVKWHQASYPTGDDHRAATQPALADLDADGAPEVIQGRIVLNGEDGTLQWQGAAGLGTNGFMGPVTTLGDLDLDGQLNLLAGNTMYEVNGTEAFQYTYDIAITDQNCDHRDYPCDGFTATGNFDGDDEGEMVITRAGRLYLLNHDGTPLQVNGQDAEIAIPVDDCGKNEGGPPTVADFDGDGEPEIGVAGADFYIVADLECLADPLPSQCSDPGIRWRVGNADCSSRTTGSSVFDFEGDGRAEVVYNDEENFRILDGVDGTERVSIRNTSHTRLEMPIVADVDNDGNAEIVFIENAWEDVGGTTQGLRVWGDQTDTWVPTRRIWNQHGYHVTNVSELGAIPEEEPVNWLEPTDATPSGVMNNFRQNLPEDNAFAAPDLTVGLSINRPACSLEAEVCNEGDIVAGAGVEVTFWDESSQTEIACENGPVTTTMPLPPGACETVSCTWPDPAPSGVVDVRACVDNTGYDCSPSAMGGNNECKEDNNLGEATGEQVCTPVP